MTFQARIGAAAAAALLAACGGRQAAPAAPTPQATPAAAVSAATTPQASLREAQSPEARRDSLAAAARADSAARLEADRAHADSVRAEVERGGGMEEAVVPTHLSAADEQLLATPIHFGFDQADLSPEYRALLERKAELLQRFPALQLSIAGHCDERGSDEYNLALGLRRAASAQQYLIALGIAAGRVTIVSFGEERPLDPGHDEAAWERNRRTEFTMTAR